MPDGPLSQVPDVVRNWVSSWEIFSAPVELIVSQLIIAAAVVVVGLVTNLVAKRIILKVIHRLVKRTKTRWDDALVEQRVFHRLSHIAPAVVVYVAAPLFLELAPVVSSSALAYIGLIGLLAAGSVLDAVATIYSTFEIAYKKPIRSYIQAVKIFLFVIGGIAIIGTLIHQSPWKLLSGIGALTAVILLVFKDSILGLVAGIQLSGHDMVRIGDWIEMPKYDADGDVIEISLNNVKVQNWDKTITTIPTYALVANSFRNWRGMQETGGRRIMRSLYIDMNSVRFCSPAMLDRFRKITFIEGYIGQKTAEIDHWNREHGFDMEIAVNGRRMTNLGTFRAYVYQYLRHHPKIHQELTLLVRQRPPTEHGIPIEIYAFTNDIVWANYENIQADIFDHILAVMRDFDLRVYQQPSGLDISSGIDRLGLDSTPRQQRTPADGGNGPAP